MEFDIADIEQILSPDIPSEIAVVTIHDGIDNWSKLIKSFKKKNTNDQLLIATLKLIGGKICGVCDVHTGTTEVEVRKLAVKILHVACNQDFFDVISARITAWSTELLTKASLRSSRAKSTQFQADAIAETLESLCRTCGTLLETMPFLSKDISASMVLAALGVLGGSDLGTEHPTILKGFQTVHAKIMEINKQFAKEDELKPRRFGFSEEDEERMHSMEPPDDYRRIQIVPSIDELMYEKRPFLRPNKVKGNYVDAEHYLDVQFRLLREDFVQPLRLGLEEFLEHRDEYVRTQGRKRKTFDKNQQNTNVRIYIGVTYYGSSLLKDSSTSHLFNLSSALCKKINWDKSKRLLPGCLVVFSSDNFKSAIFATTLAPPFNPKQEKKANQSDSRRQELAEGLLRVSVETGEDLIDTDANYVVIECEAFFEAYRYNLDILQQMQLESFCVQKFIVQPDSSPIGIPSYFNAEANALRNFIDLTEREHPGTLDKHALTKKLPSLLIKLPFHFADPTQEATNPRPYGLGSKVQCTVPLQDACSWPKSVIQAHLSLDNDQYNAFRAALTSELSVIQGPPGTGKTYIGLQIVKTLLLNKSDRKWPVGCKENMGVGHTPRSPILVVCYTNHALDQFLELLKQNQRGIKIVRVGGQSKSEILTGCTLMEHRKTLGRNRRLEFEEEWVAKDKVRALEKELALLKCVKAELSSLSGIVDFSRTNTATYLEIREKFPGPLLEMFRDPEWFGFTEQIFHSPYFRASELLASWFKVKAATAPGGGIESAPIQHYHATSSASENGGRESERPKIGVVEQNFDEDYDMDELLEHRLDAYDDLYHYDGDLVSNTSSYFFVEDCSLEKCHSDISSINRHIQEIVREYTEVKQEKKKNKIKEVVYLDHEHKAYIHRLEAKRTAMENKLKLLIAIFDLYNRKMLDLPDITDKLLKLNSDSDNSEDEPENDSEDEFDDDDFGFGASTFTRYHGRRKRKKSTQKSVNPSSLRIDQRWAMFFHATTLASGVCQKLIPDVEAKLKHAHHQLHLKRQNVDGLIMKYADVIGMTTTGAAKHHLLLEIARPEIVIIEEAAEILEAHAVTSITKDCKQLILIGDHLQLRPSTNVYKLGEKFHMNISLFERMIKNKVALWSLKTQHRMRPEIADLIVGPIYDELHNDESVLNYPGVRGVTKNLFLLSHTELETSDTESLSKSNYHEANFMAGFCYYLLQQGYEPNQITVLTTYLGQMFLLKKVFGYTCRGVRITCVDNYQGEENDIILLSLVRSNENDKIGFVGIDNRICVALSRARHGLFILGNVKNLVSKSETWRKIHEKLNAAENCGESLGLICKRHGTVTDVKCKEDFSPLKNGGCHLKCEAKLRCSHLCPQICHTRDENHVEYKCTRKCEKLCESQTHQCPGRCSQPCPRCMVLVTKTLLCGHEEKMHCYKDPAEGVCVVVVPRILPCGHEEDLACYLDPAEFICRRKVQKVLNCELKHTKEVECHVDVNKVKCKVLVEKVLKPCGHSQFVECDVSPEEANCSEEVTAIFKECSHECKMQCWQVKTKKCQEKCVAELNCGHKCTLDCHALDDPNHLKYLCRKKCQRSCNAGHKCPVTHKCSESCPPCKVKLLKSLPCDDSHTAFLECHDDGSSYNCIKMVSKVLPCGHSQRNTCHSDPSTIECTMKRPRRLPCGHVVVEKCNSSLENYVCRAQKMKLCVYCNQERFVVCYFDSVLHCLGDECRKKFQSSHRRTDVGLDLEFLNFELLE